MKTILLILLLPLLTLFAAKKPNVIFVITDDHGYNDLEALDLRGEVDMPNINKLTQAGALMTQAYCTAPQCIPSRAGIVTGRYQQKFGLDRNGEGPLSLAEKSIASRMKDLGYKTGHVGKWHLEPNRKSKDWLKENGVRNIKKAPAELINKHRPQGFGYDEYAQGTGYKYWSNFDINGKALEPQDINYKSYDGRAHRKKFRLELQTDLALNFLDRNAGQEKPFFLYLAYYGPHSPMDAPESLTNQVLTVDELVAKGYDNEKKSYKGKAYARDYTEAELRQQGLALLKGIDNGVGKIIKLLEAKGELENTLIFFMGDNGAPMSFKSWDGSINDPWNGSKGIIFEGGSRVPYFVYWKNKIKPQVFDKGVITLDAGATAVAVAGGDPSQDDMLDGVNLLPFLSGKVNKAPHKYIYQRYSNTGALIEGKYKYMRHESGEELLFDLTMETPTKYNPEVDKHEGVNLVKQMPERVSVMRKEFLRWKNQLPKPVYEDGYHDSLIDFARRGWKMK